MSGCVWFGGEAHDKLNPAQQNKPLNKYPPPPTLLCGAGQSWGQGCQPWSIAPAGVGAAGQCRSKPSPWPPLVGAQPQPPSAPPLLRGWEGGCLGLDPSPHSQQCAGSQPPRVLSDAATALSCPLLSPCPPQYSQQVPPPHVPRNSILPGTSSPPPPCTPQHQSNRAQGLAVCSSAWRRGEGELCANRARGRGGSCAPGGGGQGGAGRRAGGQFLRVF